MEKINLPKSTKKIYYQIFRGVNICDIAVFLLMFGIGVTVILVTPLSFIPKLLIGIFCLFLSIFIVQKDKNEVRIYELILRLIKYIAIGFWKQAIIITPNFKDTDIPEIITFEHFNNQLYLAGIKIESINLQLLNEQQQTNIINDFANLLRTITLPAKLIKTNVAYSFSEQLKNLNDLSNNKSSEINAELINLQIEQLEAIQNAAVLTTPAVYLIWVGKTMNEVNMQLKSVLSGLSFGNLKVESLNQNTLKTMWNEFTFDNVSFKASAIKFKSNVKKIPGYIWSINNLPKQINYFWLNQIFSLNNANICINLEPINKVKAQKQLDNAINKIKTNANYYANSASQQQQAEQYLEAFLTQQQAVVDDTDVLKDISILIIVNGSAKEINNTKRELKHLGQINGWKYDNLAYLQNQAILACYSWTNLIAKTLNIEMTCDVFATSFPIPDMPLNDKKGFLLAETVSGKPVVWDLFNKTNQRVNQNMLILGESGSGKSFTIKKIILNLAYQGTKIYILDPEREYQNLTKNLEGEWLDTSGANGGIINPFEIYKLNDGDDNGDTFNNQMSLLESFFTLLFPTLQNDDELLTLLMELVKTTYLRKEIKPSTDFNGLKKTIWPTFSDLAKLISEKIKHEKKQNIILKLESLNSKLTALTQGTYAKYWNGQTKFKIKNSNLTCFDLQQLTNIGNQKIINVQMLLILRLLGQQLIAIKRQNEINKIETKIAIVVDEAHLLANESNSIALDFLFHTMKRIRKYGGSLIIITQNLNDFTGNENLKKKFTGIINNCSYWLIGGMQPNDVQELNKMYQQSGGLSEAVKNYIATANKGKFWFKISKQEQLPIQILQLDVEVDLVGN